MKRLICALLGHAPHNHLVDVNGETHLVTDCVRCGQSRRLL